MFFLFSCIFFFIPFIFCAPNVNVGESCKPSDHVVDGAFYCTEKHSGWDKEGAMTPIIYTMYGNAPRCYKHSGNCNCEDCGEFNTQCKDFRCDDEFGHWSARDQMCYNTFADGVTRDGPMYNKQEKFDCYKKKVACDHSVCDGDEHLVGCMRTSGGLCEPCPDPTPDFYYAGGKGSRCAKTPCTKCTKTQYEQVRCLSTTNTRCSDCPIQYNKYLSGLKENCLELDAYLPCNVCDPTSLYEGKIHGCPPPNNNFGYSTIDITTRQCKECISCQGETYFRGVLGIKCVTDRATQCESIALEFRFGSKRVKGEHNSSKNNNDGDKLPSYQPCDISPFPIGSIAIDPPPSTSSISNLWIDDCNFLKVGQCDIGRYLKMNGNLALCPECPNDNKRTPKGSTKCLCSDGQALEEDIKKANGILKFEITPIEQMCYNCANDILMPVLTTNGIIQSPESVVCFQNGNIQRCGLNEIVTKNECVLCTPGSISNSKKDKCIQCERGKYFNNNRQVCVACNGAIEFCPDLGMLKPLIKIMTCEPTFMLNLNQDPEKDNSCTKCPNECDDQNVLIYASGRNGSNGCSLNAQDGSSVKFFACYPENRGSDVPYSFIGKGKRLRFQQGTSASNLKNQVFIDDCPSLSELVPHAEWVDSSTNSIEYPLGCVFACKYGWNLTLGHQYQNATWSYLIANRPDLYSFWESVTQSFSIEWNNQQQSKRSLIYAFEKVLWPLKDDGASYINPNTNWEQRQTITLQSIPLSASYNQLNTFLYLEDFHTESFLSSSSDSTTTMTTTNNLLSNLCLNPNQLETTSCPLGFFSSNLISSTSTSTSTTTITQQQNRNPCAIWARTYGIYKTNFNDDSTSYYVIINGTDPNRNILCHLPITQIMMHYWSSYSQCKACMDRNHPNQRFPQSIWLRPNDLMPNRYEFKKVGSCDEMTCSLGAVASEGACIPCNANSETWNTICSPAIFVSSYCSNSIAKQLTTNDVCIPCPLTDPKVMIGVLNSKNEIDKWKDARIQIGWKSVIENCMYICGDGYTSNSNEITYTTKACILCEEVIQNFISNGKCINNAEGESFFNEEEQLNACNLKSSYLPFIPECKPCFPLNHLEVKDKLQLKGPNNGMVTTNDECLALCDSDLYFTLHINGSKIKSPIQQGEISRCVPCEEENLVNCQNLTNCISDYFWNGFKCQECNQSECNTTIGLYRTQCKTGSWFDSTCGICPKSLLFNDPLAIEEFPSISDSLKKVFDQSQLTWSRRWAPLSFNSSHLGQSVFKTLEGCFVTCINNYAWIDLTTGKPPLSSTTSNTNFQLQKQFACLPCNLINTQSKPQAKFSVWNFSRGNGGRFGGCYTCPEYTDTIIESDIMCESNAGYGKPIGNPVNVTIVIPPSDTTMTSNFFFFTSIPRLIVRGKKRNLLQSISTSTTTTTSIDNFNQQEKMFVTVPSLRLPFIRPSTQSFFLCCGTDIPCRLFTKADLDRDQNSLGIGSAYDKCISSSSNSILLDLMQNNSFLMTYNNKSIDNITTSRRHLSQSIIPNSDIIQACYTSQYNTERGDNICYNCPIGSSTAFPFVGKTSLSDCLCLGGYYRSTQIREGEKVGRCIPCGMNRHRSTDMPETTCKDCPNGMITPTSTSVSCYCAPGWYQLNNNEQVECSICPAGSYCEGGTLIIQCPLNSMSKSGSKTRSDCICQTGYFGSLATPDSVCMSLPFAQSCDDINGCNCTIGWNPIYKIQDGISHMYCISDCALGEYAQVNPSTFEKIACKKCPMNTYSSNRQTIEIIGRNNNQQCTPCPFNYETMAEGQTSVLDCLCKKGVVNSTTSQCGLCAAGTYLDTLKSICRACPIGSTSPAGSIGLISCICPIGSRLKSGYLCEPCPLNTYSSSAGRVCTPCPIPMITMTEGSKSFSDCKCPPNYYQHAGRCISII